MLLRFPFPERVVDMVDAKHPPRRKAAGSSGRSSSWGIAAFLVSLVFLLGVLASGALAFGDGDASTVQVQALNLRESSGSQLHFGNAFERRRLLQTQPSSNTRLLAVRGDRRDPLNSFHKYRGGYDVKNKHYWASAIYTGVYGFAIGVAWLLLGALLTLLACFKLCCCRREKTAEPRSSFYYWLPRILVLLLSLFAIGCIITLFIRNRQFHTQAFRVRDSISSSADEATGAVRNVSSTLSRVDTLVRQYNIAGLNQIGTTVTSLNQQADKITNEVNSNIRTYNRLINGIEIALIVILAVALFLVVLGLIAAIAGWRTIFFLVILLGWLLTALVWILFGLFFAVNNITSDTCQAFGEYLQAPANTTLDDLLPCVDLNTASSASSLARQGVDNIILQANNVVTQIRQASAQVGGNASLPNVCDPIGPAPTYTYTSQCPSGTVPIGQLPQVVQPYVCTVEPLSNECLAAGRVVTPTQNRTIGDLSESGQSLVNIIPTVTSLTNCSFVYNTFNALVTERCSPAKQSLRNLWIPLLLLSIAMTLLSAAWILANHRNKKQRYSRTIHSQESPRGYK